MQKSKTGEAKKDCASILTNDVSPRDSQDDKILPEHSKFNPKVNSFTSWNYRNIE